MNFLAFTVKYKGIANKLITPARVSANGKTIETQFAQWDTGAAGTCVSKRIADVLGLKPCGYMKVNTPSGQATMPLYFVDILLRNGVTVKSVRVMGSEIGAQGIDLLIGMDIIALGDFSITIENNAEKMITCFSFRIPSIETIDYVEQYNNMVGQNT